MKQNITCSNITAVHFVPVPSALIGVYSAGKIADQKEFSGTLIM